MTMTAAKKLPAKKQAAKRQPDTKVKKQPTKKAAAKHQAHPFGTCRPLSECDHWI